MTPFGLWILGLGLIFMEFYLPGAVMGTAGGLLIFASALLFIRDYNSPFLIAFFWLLIGLSIVAVVKYAIWKIPRTKSKDSIYSNDAQVGFYASSFDKTMIGKEGIVMSDLKPGGYILVAGKQQAAISESGYLTRGSEVIVLRGEGDSLIVKSKG